MLTELGDQPATLLVLWLVAANEVNAATLTIAADIWPTTVA